MRGLQQGSGSARVAYVWYADSWTLDVNITDGAAHQLALYLVDWDTTARAQRMEVRDAVSGTLLDVQNASSYNSGQYWIWHITGHVTITLVKTATTVTGLTPGTMYAFQARALLNAGFTDWSDSVTFMCT